MMLNDITGGTWAVDHHAAGALRALAGQPVSEWGHVTDPEASAPEPTQERGVAVIPLSGLITPFPSLLSLMFGGGGGLQTFRARVRAATADTQVSAIVLNVNSPGGLTSLVPEAAADVRAARQAKPVVAVANTLATSAAYWIASQAGEVVVTPSGRVGSIGVFALHEDVSRMEDEEGVTITYIAAGKFKVERNRDQPLSDEAREAWQREIETVYGSFVADVAKGRGVSTQQAQSGFGQGRTVLAADARNAGMADRVATLEDTLARVARRRPAGRAGQHPGAESGDGPDRTDLPFPPPVEAGGQDAPERAPLEPDPPEPAYGLDTRRRRLSLVEQRLG